MSRVDVRLEDAGDTEELEILEVMIEAGDSVDAGEVLLQVATDKADLDVEAPAAGTVAEVLVAEGATVPVSQTLVVLST